MPKPWSQCSGAEWTVPGLPAPPSTCLGAESQFFTAQLILAPCPQPRPPSRSVKWREGPILVGLRKDYAWHTVNAVSALGIAG